MLSSCRFILLAIAALFATNVLAFPSTSPTPTKRMTNSQRFARGLPPNAPSRRSNHGHQARTSPVPQNLAATPQACQPRPGLVQALSVADGSVLGYLRDALTGNGTYGLTQNRTEAMFVQANCDGAYFDLNIIGSNSPYPLVGVFNSLSSDSGDLKPGSSNCAQFSGVKHTDPGSPAKFLDNAFSFATNILTEIESSIWSLDDATDILSVQWINEDGSRPKTSCTWIKEVDTLYLTGDVEAFAAAVPSETVVELTLKLVSQ